MAQAPRLVIVGQPTCVLCGRKLTQEDADAGQLLGITPDPALVHVLFCIDHFYVKIDGKWVATEDADANMERLTGILAKGLKP